ncbi:MAG: efflux RND transporter periplasmic adaptor subunit [Thermomonas sp.]
MPLRRFAPILSAILMLAACGKSGPGERKDAPVVVTTTRVAAQPWQDSIEALGTARANESIAIVAKVSDVVTRLAFDSGERVRAGQLLVDMNSSAQRADVAAAAATLRDAEQQLRRGSELARQQLIAQGQLETLRANRDAAAAALASRRAAVADRTLVAPFAGVLGLRQVSVGALVGPGTTITTLDDDSRIKLDFTVSESALSSLARGQAIGARSDAWPGVSFDGTVADIDSRIDPDTRAVTVRAELPNPDGRLRAGMLLRVAVRLPERQALALPEIAVQQEGTQAGVFRVGAGDKVELVPVQLGSRNAGKVEIASGLKAGDRVVVEGIVKLHDGSSIVEAAPAARDATPAAAE